MDDFEYIEGLQYSDEVLNAARYGYQYRLEAEKYSQEKDYRFHQCLGEVHPLICWLVQLIINGISWDLLKKAAGTVIEQFQREKRNLSPKVRDILTEQQSLQQLYEYVKEFKEGRMNISDRERKYIKEEIEADYTGKQVANIFEAEHRFPTDEEYKRIFRDAQEAAKKILSLAAEDGDNEGE